MARWSAGPRSDWMARWSVRPRSDWMARWSAGPRSIGWRDGRLARVLIGWRDGRRARVLIGWRDGRRVRCVGTSAEASSGCYPRNATFFLFRASRFLYWLLIFILQKMELHIFFSRRYHVRNAGLPTCWEKIDDVPTGGVDLRQRVGGPAF